MKQYSQTPVHVKATRRVSPIFSAGMFVITLLFLSFYIYFVNRSIVDTLLIQRFEQESIATEEEIRNYESEFATLAVGINLKEEAARLGLEDRGPAHFVARDSFVAHAKSPIQ